MNIRIAIAAASGALLLGLVASPASSASLYVVTSNDCGQSLMVSGTLKGDVDCSSGGAISFGSDRISLNLNGYTITGRSDSPVIAVNGRRSASISGGTLRAVGVDGIGVYIENAPTVIMTKMRVIATSRNGNGVYALRSPSVSISNSSFTGFYTGVSGTFSSISLSSSVFTDNNYGFVSNEDTQDVLVGDTFTGNGVGITVLSTSMTSISNTVADNNAVAGMHLYPNGNGAVNVSSSFARGNSGPGIALYQPYALNLTSSVTNTIASGNLSNGFSIEFPGALTFKGNTANRNGGDGVRLLQFGSFYGPVAASGNTANYNQGYGLYAEYATYGTGNKAVGNGIAGCLNFVCR